MIDEVYKLNDVIRIQSGNAGHVKFFNIEYFTVGAYVRKFEIIMFRHNQSTIDRPNNPRKILKNKPNKTLFYMYNKTNTVNVTVTVETRILS